MQLECKNRIEEYFIQMAFTLSKVVHHGQYKNTPGKYFGEKIIFLIDEHHYLTMYNHTYRIILACTLNVHILNSFQCKT